MSSLYTTKSLGRPWLPSPVRSQRSRYGSWPHDPPKLRWLSSEIQRKQRWSKTHERFALLSAVLLLGLWWCSPNFTLPTLCLPWPSQNKISDFAYITSASNPAELCSSLMHLESLQCLGAKAERVLLYPETWDLSPDSPETKLLRQAQEEFGARLQAVPPFNTHVAVFAANQTAYKLIIALDPDSTILKSMDELFFSRLQGGSILSPSSSLLQEKDDTARHTSPLPRTFQTSTLRNHQQPTSSVKAALVQSNLARFSDGPPYKSLTGTDRDSVIPICPSGVDQCEVLEVWQWLYADFRARRKEICGAEFNEWEAEEALDAANRRVISLQDRVNGVGGNSGM